MLCLEIFQCFTSEFLLSLFLLQNYTTHGLHGMFTLWKYTVEAAKGEDRVETSNSTAIAVALSYMYLQVKSYVLQKYNYQQYISVSQVKKTSFQEESTYVEPCRPRIAVAVGRDKFSVRLSVTDQLANQSFALRHSFLLTTTMQYC